MRHATVWPSPSVGKMHSDHERVCMSRRATKLGGGNQAHGLSLADLWARGSLKCLWKWQCRCVSPPPFTSQPARRELSPHLSGGGWVGNPAGPLPGFSGRQGKIWDILRAAEEFWGNLCKMQSEWTSAMQQGLDMHLCRIREPPVRTGKRRAWI